MQTLRELQADLAQAILSDDAGRVTAEIVDDVPGAAARLAIYRNHYRVGLIEALAAAYGVAFPSFLGSLPALAAWPWIAGLARLDWAIHAAWNAPDAPVLAAASLAGLTHRATGDLRLRLHPSCRTVGSRFAIDRLRQGQEEPGNGTIEVAPEPVRLLAISLDHLIARAFGRR